MSNSLHGEFNEMINDAMVSRDDWKNRLYYGDCLTVMKQLPDNCVDLIYLDPPFNSNRDYHSIYKDETGRPLPEQIQAFTDMWEPNEDTKRAIEEIPDVMLATHADQFGINMWKAWVDALRKSRPSMLAYLAYMAERLLYMRMVLKPTGSLYFHCDPTASHYIKVFMDGAFGHDNFQNEIVWCYRGMTPKSSRYNAKHDIILYYKAGQSATFNRQKGTPTPESLKTYESAMRRGYNANNARNMVTVFDREKYEQAIQRGDIPSGMREKIFDGGRPWLLDWWADIKILGGPKNRERLGYKTQKPLALLERIVQVSSNKGDLVLDPFCGCGTTMEAAHKLGRRWIGIDIAIHAVNRVTRVRLEERLGLTAGKDFIVDGVPNSIESARALWERDPYHFQTWAVEIADGFVTARRGNDGGVDGRLYFEEHDGAGLKKMILQVKGGKNVGRPDAQRLAGVLHGSDAELAGLIVMDLTDRRRKNIETEMKKHGEMLFRGVRYPKMQLLTVAELLEGKRFDTPPVRGKQPSIQRRL